MRMDIRKIKKLIENAPRIRPYRKLRFTEGEEAGRISRKSSNDIVVEKPTSERKVESIVSTETKETKVSGSKTITSPIVGTFYRRPAPDKDPYVKVGDVIDAGQIVCIVEAMKMMNEIKSEFSGKIVSIEVEDGEPVQFSQDLITLE
jgi:acetyl-CoA carboxylase, biotin carboxyl carrier protein